VSNEGEKKLSRRKVEVLVISDLHLGTVGCHAKELLRYLKSVDPVVLVLNGDIIDCWQFKKWYWPKAHMKVLKRILKIAAAGVPVHYVTGNHDDMLRRFAEQHLGNFHLVNKVVLELDGKRAWIFHGDVFDVVTRHSRWLARLGGVGYDLLILINRGVNRVSMAMGRGRISLSKRIKEGVKSAVSFIGDFEKTTAAMAIEEGYDYVLCGHIHQPVVKEIATEAGRVLYMNSGDWIENLTALEFTDGRWSIFRYREHEEELESPGRAEEVDPEDAEDEAGEGALPFPTFMRVLKAFSLPRLSSPRSQP
jgi:UDP-2,3-diacylglucosamine pyrophosphatase LpxH